MPPATGLGIFVPRSSDSPLWEGLSQTHSSLQGSVSRGHGTDTLQAALSGEGPAPLQSDEFTGGLKEQEALGVSAGGHRG